MALLPELDVRSILDVVEENFAAFGKKTYAIRAIYVGEHTLNKEEITKLIRRTVHNVNSSYCDINVTGILLVYEHYFIHILEGSEDTVYRQIRFMFQRERQYIEEMAKKDEEEATEGLAALEGETAKPDRKIVSRSKMLMVYHSIKTLYFDNWRAVSAKPPTLVSKLDVYAPIADHIEQLKVALDKISKLCEIAKNEDELVFEGLSAVDPRMEALPEVALLDFLLQSKHLLDLRYTSFLHRRVDDHIFYSEDVWPLPSHFTPRHLYKLKVDDSFVEPLPVMPWEIVKKEAQEDEEREDRESGSDSSE